jgi:hypothetical protein
MSVSKLFFRIGICLLSVMLCCLPLAGCKPEPAVGEINDEATVALIRLESQESGIIGVVYRQINRFESFLAESTVPVLVVFYDSMATVNIQVIPFLEQLADDDQGLLQIVWIDAGAEQALADSFNVEELPQFTVVVEASLKRSMIGFDDEGSVHVRELLTPYLPKS